MLKAAVIGVGSIGQNHARVYRNIEGVTLVGVADASPQAAARVGTRENVSHYTDPLKMLDDHKPDLVSVAVPTSLHFDIAQKVIDRGIHALIEKPITTTIEQGEALLALAKKKGVTVAVGHIERFNPAVMELRRRLTSGMAGRIYTIVAQRLSPYPSRIQDAGVVIDLASHDIDLMRYLVPEPVLRLYGETMSSINSDREDSLQRAHPLQERCGGRSGRQLDDADEDPPPDRDRRARVPRVRPPLPGASFLRERDGAQPVGHAQHPPRRLRGERPRDQDPRHEPLAAELTDFVRAVRDGRAPTVTGEEGLETLRLALEFVRSGSEGRLVTPEPRG